MKSIFALMTVIKRTERVLNNSPEDTYPHGYGFWNDGSVCDSYDRNVAVVAKTSPSGGVRQQKHVFGGDHEMRHSSVHCLNCSAYDWRDHHLSDGVIVVVVIALEMSVDYYRVSIFVVDWSWKWEKNGLN